MTPEISEFSYGFALTNELVGWADLKAAPIFPSLIEEGKEGGGYDVKLDMPAIALYLQFKRADCMTRSSAKEISKFGAPLSVPFYRFPITQMGKSDQHELLLALDDGSQLVFYVAPRFHELSEINQAWQAKTVAGQSIFVSPKDIGSLDLESHTVAYDGISTWLCSEPKPVTGLNSRELLTKIKETLTADKRTLREKLPGLVVEIHEAELRAVERAEARRYAAAAEAAARRQFRSDEAPGDLIPDQPDYPLRRALSQVVDGPPTIPRAPTPPMLMRPERALAEPEEALREIADTAARIFDVQLIIAQDVV